MRRKASHPGNLPVLYEVYEIFPPTAEQPRGLFMQVTEAGTEEQTSMLFDALMADPETRDRRFIMVTVTRSIIVANFDTNELARLNEAGSALQ